MTDSASPVRVCFVCLGNICRSPTAEGVFRHLVAQAGLSARFAIDSAGTAGYHAGEAPDHRARAAGKRAGVIVDGAARQFLADDFARFDHVIAMDSANLKDLHLLAQSAEARAKVRLLRSFDPTAPKDAPVPDPYYGNAANFDQVLELCRNGLSALARGDPPRAAAVISRALQTRVESLLGQSVRSATRVSGGDINDAFELALADRQSVFLKTNAQAPLTMFAAEARGLEFLREAYSLRIPQVLAVSSDDEGPPFLLLEFIRSASLRPDFDEQLGRGLANLHRFGAPSFGFQDANFIGRLAQENRPHASWAEFYRHQRLEPQLRAAAATGQASLALRRRFDQLFSKLSDLVGAPEAPARLHGDLWSGNLHVDEQGAPCLIDPAVYGGHREMDLAMMRLFGGFSERVFAAYAEAFPLSNGHAERVHLCQLYPLLVHVNLFGGSYLGSVERALTAYL